MKISKHVHSCLLLEEDGKVVLIDPGNYTTDAHALNISALSQLDEIAITHEHADHLDIPTIKELVAKFPHVKIYSNASVKDILANEHIEVLVSNNENIQMMPIAHEKIWMGERVANVAITLFGRLTTPGDSFAITQTTEILALPLQGPWGSMMQAVDTVLRLKPKIIIPIHDYHLKDEFRKQYYQRLKDYFLERNMDFKAVETGEIIEV